MAAEGNDSPFQIDTNEEFIMTSKTEDEGHPMTTSGSGKFQQPVLRGDNKLHIDPKSKVPTSPEVQPPKGGSSGIDAQIADLKKS